MSARNNEFQRMLCKLYMLVVLCVLPLYTGGTYAQLGDTKYLLFRNVSFVCVALWLAAEAVFFVEKLLERRNGAVGIKGVVKGVGRTARVGAWSIMDTWMAAYGASVLLSAILSPYGKAAWTGYRDWYMGAVSQLLFVAIYFMVSRCYDNSRFLIYLGEGTMLLVCVIAFLQRLQIDVLGLHKIFNEGDWEYKHMLSTVGNINWLCGYLSVVIAFSVSAYLHSGEKLKRIWHYLVSVAGLALLCIQGSDIGWVLCAGCMGICFVWGRKDIVILHRSLLLTAGTIFGFAGFGKLVLLRGSIAAMPADGNVYERISWAGWWLVLAALLLLFGFLKWVQGRHETFLIIMIVLIMLLGLTGVALGRTDLPEDFWQEGRGALWKLAWSGFSDANGLQKIVGAGPDCFAEYLHNGFQTGTVIHTSGHWEGAVFANAHNEWLNQLVNIGILGTACYLGVFVTAIKRYRGILVGVLAAGLYFMNSLVSFQQVLNAPFLFLVLGLCENKLIVPSRNGGCDEEVYQGINP